MNNLQRAKLDTCNRVKDCITKFDTELSTINEFATEKTALMDALETISAAAKVQIDTSGAVADAVQAAKENMVAVVIKYARRGNVVANQNNNITLASELDHGITYLLRASKSMALHRAEVIRDHLNNHLATLTNITAANITEITNAIEAYDKVKENPTINKQSRSASGTLNLPEALAKAFKAIENMNKLVKSYFIDINKTLVDEFELASKILITGVHRTGVEGLVTQNGNAIANATVVLVGTDRVTKTDIDGHYLIAKIKTGDYTVEVSNASGEKASKMIHVSQGHIETLDLTL